MPIIITTIEADIYRLDWIGNVTMDNIELSHDETRRLATEASISAYVHILDLSEMKSFPFNVLGLWNLLKRYPEAFAVLLVDTPVSIEIMSRMLSDLTPVTFETFNSVDQAVERARTLLAKRHT